MCIEYGCGKSGFKLCLQIRQSCTLLIIPQEESSNGYLIRNQGVPCLWRSQKSGCQIKGSLAARCPFTNHLHTSGRCRHRSKRKKLCQNSVYFVSLLNPLLFNSSFNSSRNNKKQNKFAFGTLYINTHLLLPKSQEEITA